MSNIQKVSQFMNGESVKQKFAEILGKRSDAFVTSVLTTLNQNYLLQDATKESVYSSALMAATLNLPLGLGHAYIVPYKNTKKGVTEAQFQLGYKGLKQLAIRSGQFKRLYAKEVFDGQLIEDDSFVGYSFDWKGKKSDKIIGYASYFQLTNGFESIFYMSVQECLEHAGKFSQSYKNPKTRKNSLWETDQHKMSLKTVSKLHLNSGEAPLSIDLQRAIISDQSVINDVDTMDVDYIDNEPLSVEQKQNISERERVVKHIENAKTVEDLAECSNAIADDDELYDIYQDKLFELSQPQE